MTEPLLKAIYQDWPTCPSIVFDLEGDHVPGSGKLEDLGESGCLRLCREASHRMLRDLNLQDGDLPLPFIADHCWERWTECVRKPSAELHLPFIFLDKEGEQEAVSARLIFQLIRNQACSGSLYPAREMQGVQTDAEWDGAIEAALYHATQNGFAIPENSDLRWRVELVNSGMPDEMTGRSAGVTFLLALFHFFGKVAEWNTRQAFESIIALAALPTLDQTAQALIHLGGDESKKALALHDLGHHSGSQHLHVILAGSFAGFQNVVLPPLVKITHAETVAQLKSAIQEIIRRERMSALEKPQALIFEDYLKLKRKGFVGREWLFEEMDLWRFESEERALLITGDPGSGKTSLVAELVHRNPGGQVIGYHCCQSNEIGTLRPGRFVQSLAAMIASCLPCYAELLNGDKLKRALGDERCEKDPGGALLEGILHPLQNIPTPDGGIRYILVDALDESIGMNGQRTIPDILASHIQRFPSWLRLVATTRNEPKVMQSLSGLRAKQIDATDDRNLRDLTTYLYQRLSEPSLAERLAASRTTAATAVQHISRKSCGNFLYAVQVLDGIARDDYSFANLDVLPRGLDGIYLDFFHRIYGHENTQAGEATYQRARPLLQILCTALEPLTRAELASASQLDSEEELPQMLRKLAQLLSRQIRATGEETLTFHHKSVPDWLTTHLDTNAFAVGPTKGRKRLAEFCRESLASSRAKPSWYVRRHAVKHFLEVADWDNATEALCDLEFIEARAIAQELPAMLMDYSQVAKLLPEGEKERQIEVALQAELDRYAREMNEYAADWSRIRDGSKEKSPGLPHPVKSVQLWTPEEIAAERKRMTETPNRLDRVRAFRVFVASNTEPLQKYTIQEGFAANLARNDAPAGPVHEEGKRRLNPLKCIKLIRRFAPQERYNPLPACRSNLDGHNRTAKCVVISSDSRFAISGGDDGTLRIWDLESMMCIKTIEGHCGAFQSIAISGDFTRAFTASDDHILRLWDLTTGQCIKTLGLHMQITAVALSYDGLRGIARSASDMLHVWDLVPCEGIGVTREQNQQVDSSNRVSEINQDYSIYRISERRLIRLSSQDSARIKVFNRRGVTSIALSSDGKLAVLGTRFGTLLVFDLDSGNLNIVIEGAGLRSNSIALSADARRAVTSGRVDKTVKVWDLESGQCLKILKGHTGEVQSIAISADGRLALSGSDDTTMRLWDLEAGKCLKVFEGHNGCFDAVAMGASGHLAVSASWRHSICVWNLQSFDYLEDVCGQAHTINHLAIRTNGQQVVAGSADNYLHIWDWDSGLCIKSLAGHTDKVTTLALSLDGSRAVSGSDDKSLRLWNIDSGQCLAVMDGHTCAPRSINVSADGTKSARAIERSCAPESINVSADGLRVVSGSFDHKIRIWDVPSGKCLKILKGHRDSVFSFALNADGSRALSRSWNNTLRMWDLNTGEYLKVFYGHTQPVRSVVLCADGRRAISGGEDKKICVWEINSGECIKELIINDQINYLTLCGDDRLVVIESWGDLSLWDLESGKCLTSFCTRGVRSLAFNNKLNKMAAAIGRKGRPEFFEFENIPLNPLITTAQRMFFLDDLAACNISVRPNCCGQLISIPLVLAERIEHWHLAGDERSDNAYADPALLFKCTSCETPLRMNPFFLDVKPITA